MKRSVVLRMIFGAAVFSGTWVVWGTTQTVADEDPIDFNRDIRPILSDRCYQCHGPDEQQRQGGLRLDDPEAALAEVDSGFRAIVPGDLAESVLVERITHDDPSMRMPPEESNKSLSQADIDLLIRWIEEGAEFSQHWSFVGPQRPTPPRQEGVLAQNAIDYFIAARLRQLGLEQSPMADRETLIRRVTLDLTGLPPTIEEIDAFLNDQSPDAYEKVVDRLLRSPRYGEHMTRYWLDAARYGDTHGLHLDNQRQIWPYRDWVIDAFNRNMRFDQFTIEQLAGDLLPDPTVAQRVATGFNRCNVTTSEGGSIDEEYRVRYAVDRVETTSTVFMGLTTGCAVCHDHKFDPISQHEFYQLYAYFYNFAEREMDGNAMLPPPVIAVPNEQYEIERAEIESRIAQQEDALRQLVARLADEYVEPSDVAQLPSEHQDFVWIDDAAPEGAKLEGNSPWNFVSINEHPVHHGDKATFRQATGLSQHFFTGATQTLIVGEDDKLFAYVYLDPENPPQEIMLQFNDGQSWDHRAYWGENRIDWGQNDSPSRLRIGDLPEAGKWVRLEVPVTSVGLSGGQAISGWAFTQFGGSVYWDYAGIHTKTPQNGSLYRSRLQWETFALGDANVTLPADVRSALEISRDERTDAQDDLVLHHFIQHFATDAQEQVAPLQTALDAEQGALTALQGTLPQTLVMEDRPRDQWKPAYVLKRGQYDTPDTDRPVDPNVPGCLPAIPDQVDASRLDLARWLVSGDHPLTARVTVNRYWQQLFGTGIVKTSEDFGAQGEFPTHPELLDWLAVEFVESGWDVKAMMKLLVMSHTYRQSSVVQSRHREVDAANRYYARGPRFRLDAEAIRDSALFVAGIMHPEIGGPSVKPYQPAGLWKVVGYTSSNTANFQQDHGSALYRRSMYTFWKRTSPPPSMQLFDAPSREVCVVRRERTNTPAGALVVMNDIQFVEAARCFAERVLRDGGETDEQKLEFAFRCATGRVPNEREMEVLARLLGRMRTRYADDAEAASALAQAGEFPRDESFAPADVAAWTIVTSTLLNLDEMITKG